MNSQSIEIVNNTESKFNKLNNQASKGMAGQSDVSNDIPIYASVDAVLRNAFYCKPGTNMYDFQRYQLDAVDFESDVSTVSSTSVSSVAESSEASLITYRNTKSQNNTFRRVFAKTFNSVPSLARLSSTGDRSTLASKTSLTFDQNLDAFVPAAGVQSDSVYFDSMVNITDDNMLSDNAMVDTQVDSTQSPLFGAKTSAVSKLGLRILKKFKSMGSIVEKASRKNSFSSSYKALKAQSVTSFKSLKLVASRIISKPNQPKQVFSLFCWFSLTLITTHHI